MINLVLNFIYWDKWYIGIFFEKKMFLGVMKSFVFCNNLLLKEFLIGCIFYKVLVIMICFSEICW